MGKIKFSWSAIKKPLAIFVAVLGAALAGRVSATWQPVIEAGTDVAVEAIQAVEPTPTLPSPEPLAVPAPAADTDAQPTVP